MMKRDPDSVPTRKTSFSSPAGDHPVENDISSNGTSSQQSSPVRRTPSFHNYNGGESVPVPGPPPPRQKPQYPQHSIQQQPPSSQNQSRRQQQYITNKKSSDGSLKSAGSINLASNSKSCSRPAEPSKKGITFSEDPKSPLAPPQRRNSAQYGGHKNNAKFKKMNSTPSQPYTKRQDGNRVDDNSRSQYSGLSEGTNDLYSSDPNMMTQIYEALEVAKQKMKEKAIGTHNDDYIGDNGAGLNTRNDSDSAVKTPLPEMLTTSPPPRKIPPPPPRPTPASPCEFPNQPAAPSLEAAERELIRRSSLNNSMSSSDRRNSLHSSVSSFQNSEASFNRKSSVGSGGSSEEAAFHRKSSMGSTVRNAGNGVEGTPNVRRRITVDNGENIERIRVHSCSVHSDGDAGREHLGSSSNLNACGKKASSFHGVERKGSRDSPVVHAERDDYGGASLKRNESVGSGIRRKDSKGLNVERKVSSGSTSSERRLSARSINMERGKSAGIMDTGERPSVGSMPMEMENRAPVGSNKTERQNSSGSKNIKRSYSAGLERKRSSDFIDERRFASSVGSAAAENKKSFDHYQEKKISVPTRFIFDPKSSLRSCDNEDGAVIYEQYEMEDSYHGQEMTLQLDKSERSDGAIYPANVQSNALVTADGTSYDANSHISSNGFNSGTLDNDNMDDIDKHYLVKMIESLLCIFPKIEPLPWGTFFKISLWCALPPAGYIIFFTQMGIGEHVYYVLAEHLEKYSSGLALGLMAIIFILYMLDANDWKSKIGNIIVDLAIVVIVSGFVLLVLSIAHTFPYGMVCLFALFNPLWLLTMKLLFYAKKDTRIFVSWLSGPLLFTSVIVALAWTGWVFAGDKNEWNTVAKVESAEQSGCDPHFEEYPECEGASGGTCFYVDSEDGLSFLVFPVGCSQSCTAVYNDCLNGFILWVGPVLLSMTMLFLSFFCTFFRTEGAREKDVLNFGKVWIFILFAMWVTASLAGTASGVTSALAALTLASFVASAMFLTVSFNKEERNQNAAAVFERLREKYGKHLDLVRGLFIVTCSPIVLVYFGFSVMNQFIRRLGMFPCSQPAIDPDDDSTGSKADIFTTRTRKQINIMREWDTTKVVTYAIYWGIAFMVLQVIVAKLTVVFLSWLIEQTAEMSLGVVTAIMIAVGVVMFLLPPVPGVPVYLTLGIVLPAKGHEILGWLGSVAYSVLVGLALKLFSSALQQKMIGGNLSKYVQVRQFVGINSKIMKAMRLVLEMKGLSIPKVAILIGGPDWPTSVLCGIMRLSLLQIMVGTTPVVFLIIPTCLTGTLLLMASIESDSGNPEFPWAGTVSTITASVTAVVQFGAMVIAAYYLERTADKRDDEVEAIPTDEEVKDADDRAAHVRQCYNDVTNWKVMPYFAKSILCVSLSCIVSSSYMVQLFSSLCFTEHSLTDSIDENLGGSVANLFLPLGWVAIILFFASCSLLAIFQRWGKKNANKLARGGVGIANLSVTELSQSRSRNQQQQNQSNNRFTESTYF